MKKFILLSLLVLTAFFSFANDRNPSIYSGADTSFPNYQKFGSSVTLTDFPGAPRGVKGVITGYYADTTTANNVLLGNYIKFYPFAEIYTTNPANTKWVRDITTSRWLVSGGAGTGSIVNIYNNSIVGYTLINGDSCVALNTGAGSVVATLCFNFAVCNVTFINDSTLVACPCADSTNLTPTCDTANFPSTPLYIFDNFLTQVSPGHTEFGGYLNHNTTANTGDRKMTFTGLTVQDYPYQFDQQQGPGVSTEIVGFKNYGASNVRAGINFTGATYPVSTPPDLPGYFGRDTMGYWFGSNIQGSGPYGLYTDNVAAKASAMLLHTLDTANGNTAGISFYSAPQNTAGFYDCFPIQSGDNETYGKYINMTLHTNKNLTLYGYPNTRNDGASPNGKGFYADNDGNVKYGAIGSGQSGSIVTILNDSTIRVCNGNVCDTFPLPSPITNLQNVFVVNDTTLLVCNVDNTVCDTVDLSSSPAVFDRGFFEPNQASFGATTHNANGNNFIVDNAGAVGFNFQTSSGSFTIVDNQLSVARLTVNNSSGSTIYGQDGNDYVRATSNGAEININTNDSLIIGGLTNYTSQDRLLGQRSSTNRVGYVTLGAGLSLSSGVLLATGVSSVNNGLVLNSSGVAGLDSNGVNPLSRNVLINTTSGFHVDITGAKTDYTFKSTNSSSGHAISASAVSGDAFVGVSTSGVGANVSSTSGAGVNSVSNSSYAGIFTVFPSSTNTVVDDILVRRSSTGTPTNGIGVAISFEIQNASATRTANRITSKYTDATDATYTSQFIISGASNAVLADLFTLSGSGETRLNKYGVGSFTSGTGTYLIAAKADGTLMEFPTGGLPGGGNLVTGDNGATASTATNLQWGGTLIQTTTITQSTNPIIFTSANVSGTTTTSSHVLNNNSLTTGTGLYVASSSLSSGSLIDVAVASTAAASNLQKGINVSLSGANGTASQSTFGIYSSNSHTGTNALNYGIYGDVANGLSSSAGVAGNAQGSQVGVSGTSVSGTGVFGSGATGTYGISTSGLAVLGETSSGWGGSFQAFPSSTNTEVNVVAIRRGSTGSAGNGIGGKLSWLNEASDGGQYESATISSTWADVTLGTRTGNLKFYTTNSATPTLYSTLSGTGQWTWQGYGAGTLTTDGSGNITATSDERVKHQIRPMTYGLQSILKLQPSTYIYNNDATNTVMPGFIAQNVKSTFNGLGVGQDKSGMLTLNNNVIVAALVNGMKEQQKIIEVLENRIEALEKKVNR